MTEITVENVYETFYDYKNFNDASASCAAWGGHLASIANDDEYELVSSMLLSGSKYWIGLKTDALNEQAWHWTDGSDFDFARW